MSLYEEILLSLALAMYGFVALKMIVLTFW